MLKQGAQRERVLHLLEEEGGVTEASVRRVAEATGVPEADIWGTGLFYSLISRPGDRVRVCDGLTCQILGADELVQQIRASGKICERVSCLGQCDRAPATLDQRLEQVCYGRQQRGISPDDPNLPMNLAGADDASYARLELARSIGSDGVIEQIEASGLQGRGGAAFPAHVKWRAVRGQSETERYVVCNADEAEPGTFKDRELILRQCHKVLEGLAIAAEATGARSIYIYIRGEFTAERRALDSAIAAARSALERFEIHVVNGHGAYICGEETALLESMEGKRGMPRLKPPFPTEFGFRGKPTLMHNVETAACVPAIVQRGGEWFKQLGRTEPGTKLYCISGHIRRPGVYELPLGVGLDELVQQAGGYQGKPIAFSPGGPSSGFLPIELKNVPLDFGNLAAAGSMLGSAGLVVLNDTVDMAQAAAWQLQFFERESCGQCAPCRIGTRYLRQQVDEYLAVGSPAALRHAQDVGWEMEEGSICGLGMVAAKPLESAQKHFPQFFAERQRADETTGR